MAPRRGCSTYRSSFLGLMGKTLDVDLVSLRRCGVVRILVAMTNTQILSKDKDDFGPFISTDVLVKLKGYAFTFRREPAGYVPDPDFIPFIWRHKSDDCWHWPCTMRH